MKRFGVGLSLAGVLGLSACASPEIDQTPFLGGKAGNGASGGSHIGSAGRGGSSAPNTPGSAGRTSQGGSTGSFAGAPSAGAGAPGVGGTGGLVGASGSIGQGGSGGTAASGGTSPVFESGTCASSPTMALSYQQASNNPKQITGRYQFSNTTDTPIPLAQLTIRYFFSNEESSGWKTMIYDAKLDGGTGNYRPLLGSSILAVSSLGAKVPGADSYFEISFNSTLSIEKGATGTLNWDLQPQSYNAPDQVQADDYSYNAAAVAYTVWDHVVIYQGNTLVWGCTPKEAGSGNGGAGGNGGTGGVSGSAGASGSSGSGGSNGGAGGAGTGGTAGTGGDTTGGAANGGTTSAGTSSAAGSAGSAAGGASGSSAGGDPVSAGTGGSSAGSGGTAGSF